MIIEKKLGIKGDYQYNAFYSPNLLQRNWHRNKFRMLSNYFENFPNLLEKKILDIGTGSGNFELLFHNKFKKIVGVDYNDEALSFLKIKLDELQIMNVELFMQDITRFDKNVFRDKFDFIILVDVIEHIKLEQAQKLISELVYLLTNNGIILVITPNYNSLWYVIEMVLDKFSIVPKFKGEQHLCKYNPKNLTDLFLNNNLKKIYLTTFNTNPFLAIFPPLNNFLLAIEEFLNFRYGNLLMGIYKKNDNKKERIKIWEESYSNHLGNLYKNIFSKKIFDNGHRYISDLHKNDKVILDFGCGNGYHHNFEKSYKYKKYIFADKNLNTLEYLKNIYGEENVLFITTNKINLRDQSVDIIILSHILEHLPNLETYIKEFNRILKPNGTLLVTAPCDPGFMWNFFTKLSPNRFKLKKIGLIYNEIMNYEHINSFSMVKLSLEKFFVSKNCYFYPFNFIKNHNFNLTMSSYYVKKNI